MSTNPGSGSFGVGDSQTAQAFSRLRDDIVAGRLEPGRKLKIDELRRQYGVGASPLREALSIICSEGLVVRLDQRGFRVAAVSLAAFDELLSTRCWLEERALAESIDHGDGDWEDRLVLAHHRLSRRPRSPSPASKPADDEWEAAHRAFHMSLIAGCGSGILLRFCEQLYDQNIRYRAIAGTSAYPARDIANEHCAIFEATVDRDTERAVVLLRNHYQETGKFLRMTLQKSL